MSDLLAKCDWDEDELHVYIAEWPEVVYVWVDEKTMPYAPVVADVLSLQVEIKALHELVRDMWRFTGTACKKYPRLFDQAAQGGQTVQPNMLDSFEQRMAELGIEVE